VVSVATCGPRSRESNAQPLRTSCPTTVIAITQRPWADCLFTVEVPRPTQHSISVSPVSANEDQLRLERLRQVWFIPFVHKRVGVQV